MDLDGATQSLGGLNLLCSARSFTESVADLSSSALNVPISATSVIVVTGQQAAGTCGLAELTEGCCWRVAVPCEEAEQLDLNHPMKETGAGPGVPPTQVPMRLRSPPRVEEQYLPH